MNPVDDAQGDVLKPDMPTDDVMSVDASVREQTQGAISRSVILVAAKAATWGLAFVMTVMMPRYLGATGFGRLYLAMSLTGIMAILVEFGLNSLVTREVSRRRGHSTHYLLNAAVLKTALWMVAFIILASVVRIVDYPLETQFAAAILAVSVLFLSQSTLLVAVLQAHDRMRWIAVSTVVEKLAYVGLGAAALALGYGILVVATAMLIGSVAGFLMNAWWFHRLSRQTDVHAGWEGMEVKGLFVQALPFFSVLFFGAIYFRVDVVILSLLKNDAVVGYYGAAYRLFQTTYIIPEAFLFALFPLFCRLSPQADGGLVVAARKGLDLLLLLGLPLAVGLFVLSDEIIITLYGSRFAEAIPAMRVLSIAIALMYANGVFVQLLIATERQKRLALTAGIAAVVNVSVNFVLIPPLGALGAALATVITESTVVALNFSFLPRTLTRQLQFGTVSKALLASLIMAAVLWSLNGQSLFLLVPVAVASYVGGIVMLKAIPEDDWAMMKSAIANMGTA